MYIYTSTCISEIENSSDLNDSQLYSIVTFKLTKIFINHPHEKGRLFFFDLYN